MATRFSVSLAHAGCDHTGFVVWEERERADARGAGGPMVVSLPRGFVSLNSEDGMVEIVCAGCRQTIASAARVDRPAASANDAVTATDNAASDAAAREPGLEAASRSGPADGQEVAPPADAQGAATAGTPPAPAEAPGTAASAGHPIGEAANAPADAATEDKVRADIEALFAEAEDVAPIRGDAIPQHLLDRLRSLADRMRHRRG